MRTELAIYSSVPPQALPKLKNLFGSVCARDLRISIPDKAHSIMAFECAAGLRFELAELQRQKLMPHSGIDVQGFTWASIEIEYGKT
jgi:hypothetical protein